MLQGTFASFGFSVKRTLIFASSVPNQEETRRGVVCVCVGGAGAGFIYVYMSMITGTKSLFLSVHQFFYIFLETLSLFKNLFFSLFAMRHLCVCVCVCVCGWVGVRACVHVCVVCSESGKYVHLKNV